MPDDSALHRDAPHEPEGWPGAGASRHSSATSLRELWAVLLRRRRLVGSVLGGLLLLCILYCLVLPNQYEASAKLALSQAPASSLSMEAAEPIAAASMLSAPLQLETLADVFRSDKLAWRVIAELKLYQEPGFLGRSGHRFPGFRPETASAADQDYLLRRFQKQLRVQTMPRTLLIQIRFRSKDPALSASVVNTLIRAYDEQESESRGVATSQATNWLQGQLKDLKIRMDLEQQRLTAFQRAHGMIGTPEAFATGQPGDADHNSTLLEIDELGRQLVAASTERILRESEYRAA